MSVLVAARPGLAYLSLKVPGSKLCERAESVSGFPFEDFKISLNLINYVFNFPERRAMS
jgi:hypothetical protein